MTIVNVNGTPNSGKDAFIEECIKQLSDYHIKAMNYSSVTLVKKVASILGCHGKSDRDRAFLADIKQLWVKYNNGPNMDVLREALSCDIDVLFTCIREEDQEANMMAICHECGIRYLDVLVRNSECNVFHGNPADDNINMEPENYFYVFDNSGYERSDLVNGAKRFCTLLR